MTDALSLGPGEGRSFLVGADKATVKVGRFVALIEEIGKAFPPGDGPPDEAKLMAAFSAYDTEVVEA